MNETAELLLLFQFCFFVVTLIVIVKKDIFFGMMYFFLYLYIFPALYGYWFFPEISMNIMAYFGQNIWFDFFWFATASLFTYFFAFMMFYKPLSKLIIGHVSDTKKAGFPITTRFFGFSYIIFSFIFQMVTFVEHYQDFSWYSVSDEYFMNENPALKLTFLLFKLSVGHIVILYFIFRNGCESRKVYRFARFMFLPSVAFFIEFSIKSGNRTDIAALALGIFVIEFSKRKLSVKNIIKFFLFSIVVLAGFNFIVTHRYHDSGSVANDLIHSILMQDYYAPAHMLFTSMYYNYINPSTVFLSNFYNSLVLFDYPYLQQPISEMINPGVATRSTGYAFYIFTEGYLVMGPLGFLYNGFVLVILLSIWRNFARTNDENFNVIMLALISVYLINLTRGQSSYFIKYLYTFTIPNAILYLMIVRKRWRIKAPVLRESYNLKYYPVKN